MVRFEVTKNVFRHRWNPDYPCVKVTFDLTLDDHVRARRLVLFWVNLHRVPPSPVDIRQSRIRVAGKQGQGRYRNPFHS